jgi:hypothetical protein
LHPLLKDYEKNINNNCFWLFFGTNVIAQTKPVSVNEPEAKKVLDAVSAKFKTFKTVKGEIFSLEVKDGNGKIQGTKKGSVFNERHPNTV